MAKGLRHSGARERNPMRASRLPGQAEFASSGRQARSEFGKVLALSKGSRKTEIVWVASSF